MERYEYTLITSMITSLHFTVAINTPFALGASVLCPFSPRGKFEFSWARAVRYTA
eukprot:COSAG02_NODE_40855_length_400_cov_5.076412_1_plen_54_part_01